jgi:hypothetical protein
VRRLGEDVGLQLPQRRAGVEAGLGAQHRGSPPQLRQRVALPAGPVERQREQPPGLLAQRGRRDEGLQVGSCGARPAEGDRGVGAALEGDQPQLLQPGRLAARPGRPGDLGVGGAAPQRQRPVERRVRVGGPAGGEQRSRGVDRGLEPPGVGVLRPGAGHSRGRR